MRKCNEGRIKKNERGIRLFVNGLPAWVTFFAGKPPGKGVEISIDIISRGLVTSWLYCFHRCSSWAPILRAGGGVLVNKVRTLLQWDPEAREGDLYCQTPYLSTYDCFSLFSVARIHLPELMVTLLPERPPTFIPQPAAISLQIKKSFLFRVQAAGEKELSCAE